MLTRARAYERQEQYREAIALYDEYLRANPRAPDVGAVAQQLAQLKQFQQYMMAGMIALQRQNYIRAAQQYRMALDLKPGSRKAQEGLDTVKAQAMPRPMPDNARPPMRGQRGGRGGSLDPTRPMPRPTPKG